MDPNTALDLYVATKEAEGRSRLYVRNIKLVVGGFLERAPAGISDWRRDHLIIWLARERDGRKPSTVAGRQRVLWAFIGWLYEQQDLDRDIRRGIGRVVVPREKLRTVDTALFERLLWISRQRPTLRSGEPAKPQHYWRNQAILHGLWSTGARRSELAAVEYDPEALRLKKMTIPATVAKNRRARTVAFDAECAKAIQRYVARERGTEPGPLFRCSAEAIRGLLRRLERQSGERVSSHDFRRGFAARVRRQGLDLGHTMRLLGHTTPTMTLRYSQEGEEDAAIAAYREKVG